MEGYKTTNVSELQKEYIVEKLIDECINLEAQIKNLDKQIEEIEKRYLSYDIECKGLLDKLYSKRDMLRSALFIYKEILKNL